MRPLRLTEQVSAWTMDTPTTPGWYWLRRAVFRDSAVAWHEVHPMIVELRQDGS
jgi:hypothetical protein